MPAQTLELDPALVAARVGAEQIPLIDLGPFLLGGYDERVAVAKVIGRAAREIGFFYIANHGVPAALTGRTFAEARRFFALPAEVKAGIAIEKSPCHRGWFAVGGENLDPAKQKAAGDLKEGVKIGRDLGANHPLVAAGTPLHGPNQWPDDLPGWRGAMQSYYDQMTNLGRQLMRAVALGLDLEECFFDPMLTEPMTTLGPLHYPPQAGRITESQLGAGAHTDFGCLTILAQDARGGLQVRNAQGQWIDAAPIPDTFVVNIGDMLARWTNGLYASTLHRVINVSGAERYSMPFFFDPNFDADVTVLPTCLAPGETPRFPPTTGGQHLLDMINATFEYHRDKA
ncbi:isopenicillin N synthase family dioxygenase [Zavarzinia sp. CC-PAN008]|uniref:isopenicillin N synthase family dioxygenase n=1 Tax=Zavarzinia sp. CC-PAN008 TaxID=3243332 RepID=UPI003F74637F